MNRDHDRVETVLSLSDVVHEGPLDDEGLSSSAELDPSSRYHSSSPYPTDSITSLHDTFTDTPRNSLVHAPAADSYSVEMLEREITSLLNQNASAASAALISAAAQQRHVHNGTEASQEVGTSNENVGSLGMNLTGLAAVLQAAHAQAAEKERLTQALAEKESGFATQRERDLANQSTNFERTTRSAPAFHSLTAGQQAETYSKQKSRRVDAENYLYTDDGDSERHIINDNTHSDPKRPKTSPIRRTRSPGIPSDHTPTVPGEFNDISDIINHLSSHYNADAGAQETPARQSSRGSSPILDGSSNTQTQPLRPIAPEPSSSSHPTLAIPESNEPALSPAKSKRKASKTPGGGKEKEKKGPNPHVCDVAGCEKPFSRRSDLERHLKIHSGERPFVCSHDGCSKTFIQRSALQVHLRVHTGERPHACEHFNCDKTFGDSSSLARHRRTHTGKRPHKCEVPGCTKMFTRRTTLTSHMRTHDPSWTPSMRYINKGKKQRLDDEEEEDRELEESVRTIAALFSQNDGDGTSTPPESGSAGGGALGTISAEIAAAIAHAQTRTYDEDDEEEDEDDNEESGHEMDHLDSIGPHTSSIRGDNGWKHSTDFWEVEDEDDDSDAFPVPLRTRKGKEPLPLVGNKRKR